MAANVEIAQLLRNAFQADEPAAGLQTTCQSIIGKMSWGMTALRRVDAVSGCCTL